jgi:hypothetical protein
VFEYLFPPDGGQILYRAAVRSLHCAGIGPAQCCRSRARCAALLKGRRVLCGLRVTGGWSRAPSEAASRPASSMSPRTIGEYSTSGSARCGPNLVCHHDHLPRWCASTSWWAPAERVTEASATTGTYHCWSLRGSIIGRAATAAGGRVPGRFSCAERPKCER